MRRAGPLIDLKPPTRGEAIALLGVKVLVLLVWLAVEMGPIGNPIRMP